MNKHTLYTPKTAQKPVTTGEKMVKIEKPKKREEVVVRSSSVSPILYRARGVWPFDFAPDEIIVEEQRIIVTTNYFPLGSYIGTLTIDKLSSIEVSHSIFFSSLTLQCTELHGFNTEIKWLTHKDAQSIKEIVDGIKIKELSHAHIPHKYPYEMSRTFESLGHI